MSDSDIVRESGFTLLELLVVIAVIAIIAALLLPAMNQARARANTAQDMNKLRQIGVLIGEYASDHNDRVPSQSQSIPGTAGPTGSANRWTFQESLDRYLPAMGFFNASSIYNFELRPNVWNSSNALPYPGWVPYSRNGVTQKAPIAFSYNPNINNTTKWDGRMLMCPSASQVVLMGEVNDGAGEMQPNLPATFANNVQTAYRVSQADQNALYLFGDYHIEMLKGDRGYSYYTNNHSLKNIWYWW